MNYNRLKEYVKSSKLQRKEIAERAKVTPKTIDNLLAGADPKVSTLEAVAKVIGVRIGLLFDEDIEIREAGRDYVEKGNIEHKGIEYNGNVTLDNGLMEENAMLRQKLIEAQEKIIKLMEDRK